MFISQVSINLTKGLRANFMPPTGTFVRIRSLIQLAGVLTLSLSVAACGDESRLATDDGWMRETATNQWACSMRLFPSKRFTYNCNGDGGRNGTWEVNGSSLRIILNTGQVSSCEFSFDGTIMALAPAHCGEFYGRYEPVDAWFARMSPKKG